MNIHLDKVEKLGILLVEDKVQYHEIYRQTICTEFPNVEIYFAENGEGAKNIATSKIADLHLIILDYGLPDLTGEELLEFFRADDRFMMTPIMFLTAESDDELQSRLLEKGANDFVEKGASAHILLARIAAQLRQKLMVDDLTEKTLNMEMFTAGVLHDIRNIESNLIMRCDLISRHLSKEPQLEHREELLKDLQELKNQTFRMNEYAGSILKKVRMTQKTFEPSTINFEEILEWLRQILGLEGDFHLHQETPLPKVFADAAMLKLVLLNICQNSQKYASENGVCHIYVSQTPENSGKHVTITIEDDGKGVAESELKTIFLPFHRASNSSKLKGLGLGLSMAIRVVQKMGGELWAENGKKGLKINLQLPKAGD